MCTRARHGTGRIVRLTRLRIGWETQSKISGLRVPPRDEGGELVVVVSNPAALLDGPEGPEVEPALPVLLHHQLEQRDRQLANGLVSDERTPILHCQRHQQALHQRRLHGKLEGLVPDGILALVDDVRLVELVPDGHDDVGGAEAVLVSDRQVSC
eukprot:756133-Hanusia_phi.AAC.4